MTTDEDTTPEADTGSSAPTSTATPDTPVDDWAYLWADNGGTVAAPAVETPDLDEEPGKHRDAGPSWWHREHPTFTSLTGFFTGLVTVILVPATFGAVLSTLFDDDGVARLFPFVTIVFAIPLVLIAFPRTRRFGGYMLAGMLVTAIVVLAVAAITLWALISHDS